MATFVSLTCKRDTLCGEVVPPTTQELPTHGWSLCVDSSYAQLSLFLSFSLSFSLLLSLPFSLSHFPISIWEEDVRMPTIDAITDEGGILTFASARCLAGE